MAACGSNFFSFMLKVSYYWILSAREDKIRILKQPCNALSVLWILVKFPHRAQLIFSRKFFFSSL